MRRTGTLLLYTRQGPVCFLTLPRAAAARYAAHRCRRFPSQRSPLMTEVTQAELDALGDLPPGSALETEWRTFKRELPRLLEEGHEGEWVLIKENQVLGTWQAMGPAME